MVSRNYHRHESVMSTAFIHLTVASSSGYSPSQTTTKIAFKASPRGVGWQSRRA
jgi:hypothetical protein